LPRPFRAWSWCPFFSGYDSHAGQGRIYKYDVTGGRYEERQFYATGSGGKDARSTLRKQFKDGLSRTDGTALALEALVDAADIDVGTSGPDLGRGIYPSVKIITRSGTEDVADEELAAVSGRLLSDVKG
jgi:proteasome beta subunit